MTYECDYCETEFDTLGRKRIHQRDQCPKRGPEIDMEGEDLDEIVEVAVEELLICDICDTKNSGAESISRDVTRAGLTVTLKFTCEECGAWNDNDAIMS